MRLLLVDPNLSESSPSMKGVARALPKLRSAGFAMEAWCRHSDEGLPLDRVVRAPRWCALPMVGTHLFGLWARWRSWLEFTVRRRPRPDVIYSVAWYLPDCDVCHVHFSPWDWERRQRELGCRTLREWIGRLSNLAGRCTAGWFLRATRAQRVLCVSEAVARDVREACPSVAPRVAVLPNACDSARFHPGVTAARSDTRRELGLADSDLVFVFVSNGHYRRKGFFLAAAAVDRLRAVHPAARLLVVGGTPARLQRLQAELDAAVPRWSEFIRFAGAVPDVERHLGAADALLFPSYSEALALVEVEADAVGLPLFLTRHHGSEMVLREGVNGRLVDFDAGRIAAVLQEFASGAWKAAPGRAPMLPDAAAWSERLIAELLATARERRGAVREPETRAIPTTA